MYYFLKIIGINFSIVRLLENFVSTEETSDTDGFSTWRYLGYPAYGGGLIHN